MKTKLFVVLLVLGMFILFGCEETTKPDTTPPTVQITSPMNNSTISEIVDIDINASDNKGVASVEIYIDGVLSGETTSAPWGFIWDTEQEDNGDYTLQAKAYDTSDNVGISNLVNVTVENAFVLTFNNPLFTDIEITVTGYGTQIAEPEGSAIFNFPSNPGIITYHAETSGQTTTGSQVGLLIEWDYALNVSGQSSYILDLNINSDYFFIYVQNNSDHDFYPFYVNYDSYYETMDNIIISNTGITYRIGYYRAFTNTEVRAYLQDMPSWYYYWIQGTHFSLPFTNNQSVVLYAYSSRNNIAEDDQVHIISDKKTGKLISGVISRQNFSSDGICVYGEAKE